MSMIVVTGVPRICLSLLTRSRTPVSRLNSLRHVYLALLSSLQNEVNPWNSLEGKLWEAR